MLKRAEQLNLSMTELQYKEVRDLLRRFPEEMLTRIPKCTAKIKAMADVRPIALDDADSVIRSVSFPQKIVTIEDLKAKAFQFHHNLYHQHRENGTVEKQTTEAQNESGAVDANNV